MRYHETPSCGNRVIPWNPTDMTKLLVDFRNFANAPKSLETGGFYIGSLFYPTNIFYHNRTLFERACWVIHSGATVYTISDPTGSNKSYWRGKKKIPCIV
jgi:hypothetical protein